MGFGSGLSYKGATKQVEEVCSVIVRGCVKQRPNPLNLAAQNLDIYCYNVGNCLLREFLVVVLGFLVVDLAI